MLALHAASIAHSNAMVAWQQFRLNLEPKTTILHRMDRLGEQALRLGEQALRSNQHYIRTIVEIILLCAHQEIAESTQSQSPGNFRAILDLVARHDNMFHQSFEGAARNAIYTSPEIQNELTAIMSDTVLVRTCTAAFHISLPNEAKPFCMKTPPFTYRDKLKAELETLQEHRVIFPVTQPTEWCAPIVVTPKKDSDNIRICVDLSHLN